MSGFDENPFGEPTVDNPFADPAIQQVTTNTSNAQKGLEDYNPFADQGDQRPSTVRGAANPPHYQTMPTQPAIMQPTLETPPPPYTKSGQQQQQPQFTSAEFQSVHRAHSAACDNARPHTLRAPCPYPQPRPRVAHSGFQYQTHPKRRQDELERKAADLARREEELKNTPYNARRNNWPPLPETFCVQPCFYQDINVDIPLEFQRIVRYLYYLWMFHACTMLLNVLGGMALMFQAGEFTTFGLAILYVLLFTPFSFLCWYRPAYKAFRSDSSFNFMVFFFVFFFQMIVTIMQAIGLPNSGTCGFITAIGTFDGTAAGITVGIIVLMIALCFGACGLMDILLLSRIHSIYRSSGASFAKAQQEFTSEFMSNEHVRGAASNAASAAVRSQMSASTGGRF